MQSGCLPPSDGEEDIENSRNGYDRQVEKVNEGRYLNARAQQHLAQFLETTDRNNSNNQLR